MESGIGERNTKGITTGRPIVVEEANVGAFGAPTALVVALALGAVAVVASVVGLIFRVTKGVRVASLLVGVGVTVED